MPLDSNINVYEALFISQCLNIYIHHIHEKNSKINILEIGLAYGTSSIIMLNQLIHLIVHSIFYILSQCELINVDGNEQKFRDMKSVQVAGDDRDVKDRIKINDIHSNNQNSNNSA